MNTTTCLVSCVDEKQSLTHFSSENNFGKVREKRIANTLTFLFLVTALFIGTNTYAQNAGAKEGTYQLVFNTPHDQMDIAVSAQQLAVIENLRKDNEVVYARDANNDYLKVKILPRSVINAAGFVPVAKKVFKSEMSVEDRSKIRFVDLQ